MYTAAAFSQYWPFSNSKADSEYCWESNASKSGHNKEMIDRNSQSADKLSVSTTYLQCIYSILTQYPAFRAKICSDICPQLYLFREADSIPRSKLEENCDFREKENVEEQISELILKVKWRLLYLLSFEYFRKTPDLLKKWGISLWYSQIYLWYIQPRNAFRPIEWMNYIDICLSYSVALSFQRLIKETITSRYNGF